MPRQPAIRWTTKQQKQLAADVRRFNAKLTREAKRHNIPVDFLPARLNVKDLKLQIRTASDLRLLHNRVQRAFEPGAFDIVTTPKGIATTKYQVRELKLGVRRINEARKQEADRLSAEKGNLNSIDRMNLSPKKFNLSEISSRNWEKFIESVERQARASYMTEQKELYKENYIKALRQELGALADDIIALIENTSPIIVVDALYEDPKLNIDFIYTREEAEKVASSIYDKWKEFLD